MSRSHFSIPDPEFTALESQLPPPPPAGADAVTIRNGFAEVVVPHIQRSYEYRLPPASDYSVEDRKLPVDGGEILLRCLTPTPNNGEGRTYPLLYWVHGGGWFQGNIDMDDYILRTWCVEFQISIVNVDYRLAPEHKFPTGLNDVYAGLKWVAGNAHLLSASLSKGFVVSGLSAGGNLAVVVTHRARDDPFFADKKITGQLLMIPVICHPDAYPVQYKDELTSLEENRDAPAFNTADLYTCYDLLGAPDPKDPELSPLLYHSHKGLPPTHLQVCGRDPLRDEAILYEKLLRGEGIKTRITVYPGVPHHFHYFFPQITQSLKFVEESKYGLRWLLNETAT